MNTSALIIVLLCGLNSIMAHNWLQSPVSRGNQAQSQTGCRMGGEGGVNCPGPCDRTVSQITIAPTVIQRGQSLNIKWNMHTHEGGFIRFSWCPTSQSDSKECFNQHVQQFNCKEIGGCSPSNPECSTSISAPAFLTEGAWTLQWAYFGGWFNAGDYYACVDYQVSGGSSVAAQQPARFIGGDYNNPNSNVCQYYSTNALGVCVAEPCLNGTSAGGVIQVGAPKGFNAGDTPYGSSTSTSTSSTASVPLTSGRIAQSLPITTNVAAPVTTGAATSSPATTRAFTSSPATTRALTSSPATSSPITSSETVVPVTSGAEKAPAPFTTSAVPTAPVPEPTPVPSTTSKVISPPISFPPIQTPSSSASCVSGYMKCLPDGSYSTCNHELWGVSQSCATGASCSQSGNYIYCLRPASTPPSTVPSSSPSTTSPQAVNPSTTSIVAAATPMTTSIAAPAPTPIPTQSIQTGPCTLGYQVCAGKSSYQTCGNGRDGPVWAAVQKCQTGLSCYASSTANNIYCY